MLQMPSKARRFMYRILGPLLRAYLERLHYVRQACGRTHFYSSSLLSRCFSAGSNAPLPLAALMDGAPVVLFQMTRCFSATKELEPSGDSSGQGGHSVRLISVDDKRALE